MSISTGFDWTGNLADNAERSAASVDKLVQSLRALQSMQGGGASLGGMSGNIGTVAREANKSVLVQARSAADIASIQAKSDADRNRAIGRVIEGQAKAASAISVEQAKGAQSALRAAEKAALVEQQGAIKAAQIRDKSAADIARINAKAAADMARDSHRAALRAPASARAKGAASVIAQGGSVSDVVGAVGGKAGAAIAVGAIAVGVGAKLAGLAKDYAEAVVEAQKFKEDIQEAFKTVRGTNEAANRTFEIAIKNADKLGIKRADSIGQFLDLATKGFDDAKIKEIQGRLLDITTIDPRASIEGLTKVIGKVQATGRLNQETLNELSTFGLEQSDVIKQIGKVLKKSDAEVLKALSTTGGIRGLGVDPILNAIAAQTGGGKAGDKAAEKANRNLSSLLTQIEDIPSNLLFDVQAGPGLDAIKQVLRDIIGFFDVSSETGQRTRKVLGDVFNAITVGLFGKRAGDKEGITGTLENLLSVAEKSVPAIQSAASAIGTLGRAILALTSGDTSKLDTSTKRIVGVINLITSVQGATFDIFTGKFPSIGDFLQPVLDIVGIEADASKVASFINGLVDLISPRYWLKLAYNAATDGPGIESNPVIATLRSITDGAYEWISTGTSSIGSYFVDGLVTGITSKASAVIDAVKGVASSALTTAASVLRIASPSKETTRLGEWYSEGMGLGIENKADYVSRAARIMAEDALIAGSMPVPQFGASTAATSRKGSLGSDKRITIVLPPGPLVQIVAGPGTNVDELVEMLDAPLRRLFIQIMKQVAAEG